MAKKINTKNDRFIYELMSNPRFKITKEGKAFHDGLEQKYRLNQHGYPFYRLTREGRKIDIMIHRWVWAVYGDEPLKEGYVINHKDGNKENNNISNLEQITQAENNKHAFATKLRMPVKGNVVHSQEFADQIRADHQSGLSYNAIIAKYAEKGIKLCKSYISQIINNQIWVK